MSWGISIWDAWCLFLVFCGGLWQLREVCLLQMLCVSWMQMNDLGSEMENSRGEARAPDWELEVQDLSPTFASSLWPQPVHPPL